MKAILRCIKMCLNKDVILSLTLNAAAAQSQAAHVGFCRRLTTQLITS